MGIAQFYDIQTGTGRISPSNSALYCLTWGWGSPALRCYSVIRPSLHNRNIYTGNKAEYDEMKMWTSTTWHSCCYYVQMGSPLFKYWEYKPSWNRPWIRYYLLVVTGYEIWIEGEIIKLCFNISTKSRLTEETMRRGCSICEDEDLLGIKEKMRNYIISFNDNFKTAYFN